jgi:hypothetical protein
MIDVAASVLDGINKDRKALFNANAVTMRQQQKFAANLELQRLMVDVRIKCITHILRDNLVDQATAIKLQHYINNRHLSGTFVETEIVAAVGQAVFDSFLDDDVKELSVVDKFFNTFIEDDLALPFVVLVIFNISVRLFLLLAFSRVDK